MVTAVDDTRLLEAFLAIGTVLRTCAHGHVVGPASKPMGQLIVRRYDNLVLECCYGWAPAGGHVCDEGGELDSLGGSPVDLGGTDAMIYVQLRCAECRYLVRREAFVDDGVEVYAARFEFGAYVHTNGVLELRQVHPLEAFALCWTCFPRTRRALGAPVTEARFAKLFHVLTHEVT